MDELRCEYCRQKWVPGKVFGGCRCCGAPDPAGWRGKENCYMPRLVLTFPGKLSEQAVEHIKQQFEKAKAENKPIILSEGMKLEFIPPPMDVQTEQVLNGLKYGWLTPNDAREYFRLQMMTPGGTSGG